MNRYKYLDGSPKPRFLEFDIRHGMTFRKRDHLSGWPEELKVTDILKTIGEEMSFCCETDPFIQKYIYPNMLWQYYEPIHMPSKYSEGKRLKFKEPYLFPSGFLAEIELKKRYGNFWKVSRPNETALFTLTDDELDSHYEPL